HSGGVAEVRRLHDFEILLVLRRSPRRDFVEPLAYMMFACSMEFVESVEEMVVLADTGIRNERAHGKGVDQLVVQSLILECLRGRHFALFANRLRWIAARHRIDLGEREIANVNAKIVFRARAQK